MKDEALDLAREALEMATELEEGYGVDFKKYGLKVDKDIRAKYNAALTAIKQALAAPVQEPALVVYQGEIAKSNLPKGFTGTLYATPPVAPVQEPDDSDINQIHEANAQVRYETWTPPNAATPPAAQPAPVQEPKQSPPFTFRRFVAGSERAQDVAVHREVTLDAAIRVAAKICPPSDHPTVLVYTPPAAQRQWVGLTGQQKNLIARISVDVFDAIHRTEAKLKEKNT